MTEMKCEKCGRAIIGYAGTVHTADSWNAEYPYTETWCEECCQDNAMCKCDGCREEFAEEFRMPRIDGGLFCVPCARARVPKHFDKTPIFYYKPAQNLINVIQIHAIRTKPV